MEGLPHAQYALMKASMEAGIDIAPLITPALISARNELELPFDAERYHRRADEMTTRMKEVVRLSIEKIDAIINQESNRPDASNA